MSEARLAAWRDRRREPLGFTLQLTDPDTGRPVERAYELPDHPARVWVLAYLSDDPADLLLDLLEEEDAEELWDETTDPDSDVDSELLHAIGRALLGRATGRSWWAAGRLIATLVADWATFDALATDRNLGDPLDWPIERVCNWVYLRITQHKEEDEVARIDATLTVPPDGLDPEEIEENEDEDEGEAWFAAMATLTGGVAGPDGATGG